MKLKASILIIKIQIVIIDYSNKISTLITET